MRRHSQPRSLSSSGLAPIPDHDLQGIVGGMFGQPTIGPKTPPITFPPYPPVPQRSFKVQMPSAPSPLRVSTYSQGGTGQTPQHMISASFDNGTVFANATVLTPAVPATPPMPSINGTFVGGSQTHQLNFGIKGRF